MTDFDDVAAQISTQIAQAEDLQKQIREVAEANTKLQALVIEATDKALEFQKLAEKRHTIIRKIVDVLMESE